MPISFKGPDDDHMVIDNRTGAYIPNVVRAQTSALTGQTYTTLVRSFFGRNIERTVRADIRIARRQLPTAAAQNIAGACAKPPMSPPPLPPPPSGW